MSPITMPHRALRRLARTTDPTRDFASVVAFRPSSVIATNGRLMVIVPLPVDAGRNFNVLAVPLLVTLDQCCSEVAISRGRKSTIVASHGTEFPAIRDVGADFADEAIGKIAALDSVSSIGEFIVSAQTLRRVGSIARDIGSLVSHTHADQPLRMTSCGSITAALPARFVFASAHGEAQIFAMPVKP